MAQDTIREHQQRNTSSTLVENREEEEFQALPPSIGGLPACIEEGTFPFFRSAFQQRKG
jgi:hypothetical protein